ncbi:hypothetical protein [Acetivibrio straminisolvens]|jgi:hypothetical protein|uniref:hypothetical protein n=2 Tax=Acetivibrio straminisolvens TaxID=253314 RepID=UPI00223EFE20|nr:hypothetical protein [Acetivibrio straminisolvens]
MKRLPALILALVLALNFAACGGNTGLAASDVTLVRKEANFTSLLVPSDFTEFEDFEGFTVAKAEGASIVITPIIEQVVSIKEITRDYMVELVKDSYSNVNVLKFDNAATIGGTDAVYFLFKGDDNSSNNNNTVCYINLFFTVDGQACEQEIVFTYNTGVNTSLETNLDTIINSISLE